MGDARPPAGGKPLPRAGVVAAAVAAAAAAFHCFLLLPRYWDCVLFLFSPPSAVLGDCTLPGVFRAAEADDKMLWVVCASLHPKTADFFRWSSSPKKPRGREIQSGRLWLAVLSTQIISQGVYPVGISLLVCGPRTGCFTVGDGWSRRPVRTSPPARVAAKSRGARAEASRARCASQHRLVERQRRDGRRSAWPVGCDGRCRTGRGGTGL